MKDILLNNASMEQITLNGNGKDSQFTMIANNHKFRISFEMRDPVLNIIFNCPVHLKTFNYGDTDIGFTCTPLEGKSVKIDRFQIDFPGSDEVWCEFIAELNRNGFAILDWTIEHAEIELSESM